MNRKLFVSLAPLLAIAAFAVLPVAAQATGLPHYYKNNVVITPAEGKIPTIGWGVISLASTTTPGKFVECKNAVGGYVENKAPFATTPGEGATQSFAAYECTSALSCPGGAPFASAQPEKFNGPAKAPEPAEVASLPWLSKLTEESPPTIRTETTGVDVRISCHVGSEYGPDVGGVKEVIGAGEKGQRPVSLPGGGTALNPPFVEFGPGSGELEQEGSAGAVKGKTEGEVKALGFESQDVITTKTAP
jgi:hypothetical protein